MDKKDKTQSGDILDQAEAPVINEDEKDEESGDSGFVTFKKVMRGYNPAEVHEYIEILNANLAGAQQVLDRQSAELKDRIAFVTRERDQLKAEKDEMIEKAASYDKKCSELKSALEELDSLKDQNAQLLEKAGFADPQFAENIAGENRQLKSKLEAAIAELSAAQKKKSDLEDALSGLKTDETKLTNELAKLRDENKRMEGEAAELNAAYAKLSDECSALKGSNKRQENEISGLKAENKAQEIAFAEFRNEKTKQANELNSYKDLNARQANEITQLRESNEKQVAEYARQKNEVEELFDKEQLRLNDEIRQLKLKISDLESGLKSAEQTKNKMAEEIAALREENSKQAYSFAAQKKEIEMQISLERLNRSEILQVHSYNIQKSEELLGEVAKQISQAKASLDQLNAKK